MNSIKLPEWQIARLKSAAAILDASPGELAAWLLRDLLSGDQLAQVVSEALGRSEDDVRRAESLMVLGMWETWMQEDATRQACAREPHESPAVFRPDTSQAAAVPEPIRILIADDELHVATSITLTLEGLGYQIESVSEGLQALDIFKENTRGFDLLISDHMMPVCAGSELIKRLRLAGFRGKCIVLSAYLSQEAEEIYRALGVDYIIRKPFDVRTLRLAVAEAAQAIRAERIKSAGPKTSRFAVRYGACPMTDHH